MIPDFLSYYSTIFGHYQYRWSSRSWSSFDTSSASGCSDKMSVLCLHSMISIFQETDSTRSTQTFGSRKRSSCSSSIIWISTVAPLEWSCSGCWWCDWFHACITGLSGWTSTGSGTHFTSWSIWSVVNILKMILIILYQKHVYT